MNSFPSFYVVGPDGAVQKTHHGWGGDSAALIARWLHAALGDPPPAPARRPGRRAPRPAAAAVRPDREFVKGVEILR